MSVLLLVLLGCFSFLGVTGASPSAARYDDFKVYRLNIKNEQELAELKNLVEELPLRILNEPRGPGYNIDVVIDPGNQRKLETKLATLDFDFKCIIEDLQSVLEEELGHSNAAIEAVHFHSYRNFEEAHHRPSYEVPQIPMNWTHYQRLPVIYNWLDKLAAEKPDVITPYVIGYTYENRPIKAIKISSKPGNKAVFIESHIHAIEWISSACSTCFINNLTHPSDEEMRLLLENLDWIYVPILNPDGHAYSHDVERLWRKNRSPTGFSNSSGPCYGVDLNRNFGYKWGISAYNFDVPCDHWYAGAQSETEAEVVALQKFVNSFKDDYIKMYLAFHSFGKMVLLPYGHTNTELPPNYDDLMSYASAFANGAKMKYGTEFTSGASGLVNYPVSGSAKDWAYGEKNIPFAATIELRDNGTHGFFLPRSQILESCEEVTDGLKAMMKKANEGGLFKNYH